MGGSRRLGLWIARGLVVTTAAVLLLVIAAIGALQTGWTKDWLRQLVVSQANHYLTASLEIDHLDGSLLRGLELSGVRLSRGGGTVVSIDRVSIDYSIRELLGVGTAIRRLEIDGLRLTLAREADGRWNLATLVRGDPDRPPREGPARPIVIEHVLLRDGSVSVGEALVFGAAHAPTQYERVNASFAFSHQPHEWMLAFDSLSFDGDEPSLAIRDLSGTIGVGDAGWRFSDVHVATPRSDFTVRGQIDRRESPTRLSLRVNAPRFAFQEWAGVLHGLRNIAVDARFEATLTGPAAALETSIVLSSDGGDVQSDLVLDANVPGWHGAGTATVRNLDLAHWLNRPDQRSTITGTTRFDLDLDLGGHFPRGTFSFTGPHVAYFGYEAAAVSSRGVLTPTDVRIASASARAYGVDVTLAPSTLAIDRPFGFTFVGHAAGVDLRQLPSTVPVPHVESTLALDFDVSGRFASPYLRGSALFQDSTFLGAHVGAGATGFIDTEAEPFQYRGEGRLEHVDLHRFGEALDIDWLREPRYAGTLDGDFHVDGAGAELASLTLVGGGRLFRAQMFGGELSNADVSIAIANGSLEGGYDGQLARIDPAIALDDGRYSATLTGSGRGRISVRDLFLRDPQLDDYTIDAALTLRDSSVRGFDDVEGRFQGRLAGGTLVLEELAVSSPAVALDATGTFELASARSSHVEFDISRGDLARLEEWSGQRLQGGFTSKGVLTGPWDALRVAGDLTLTNVAGPGVTALGGTLAYSAAIPTEAPARTDGRLDGTFSFVRAFGRELPEVTAALRYDAGRITTHIGTSLSERVDLGVEGGGDLDVAAGTFRIDALTIDASPGAWRLAPSAAPRVSWTDAEVRVEDLRLIDAAGESSSLSVAGTWRPAGGGALHVQATGVSIDALTAQPGVPARWGGTADVTAELTGSNARPLIDATFQVVNGRVRRLAYDRFGGQVRYGDEVAEIDVRLDQAPGVWLTAVGRVPRWTLAPDEAADRPHADDTMRVEVHSSRVALGLIEGVTDVVRNVSGAVLLNVTVVGTAKDPHFEGAVDVSDAAFEVVASGARYQHGRLALQLATDRVDVEALHLEDQQGHPLDITGSLATHELKVQDLRVAITARTFQVLRNEYGEVDINADLTFRGEFESPRLEGRIALTGGSIAVDRILDRTLSQPYSTQEGSLPEFDPLAVLNPWERMGMDVSLSIPGTLRMIGENVQVAGAPLGLGDFNLRAIGDLYLYKDPAQPLYVTGSFDSVTGTYAFQGRRFELDPNSSINFRGDVFPELYVMVRREISAVETRITISGTIREPELILASTPPLEPSDILSLIVFNTSTNDLSALQQQQLAVRAGTIAAGFLAAPMLGALERSLGIDTLEIEPGADVRGGPRVTIGNEIAPGLVARFSRQFGPAEYSEAVIEYYLSRVLSLRARFSDAGTLAARSPFRRIERAGIDLLVFFSF